VCTCAVGGLSRVESVQQCAATCPDQVNKLPATNGKGIAGPQTGFPKGETKDEMVSGVKIEDNKTKIDTVKVYGNIKD